MNLAREFLGPCWSNDAEVPRCAGCKRSASPRGLIGESLRDVRHRYIEQLATTDDAALEDDEDDLDEDA